MKQGSDHFDISYMARMLRLRKENKHRTVLVLGSRTGGLFRSEKLYDTLMLFGDPSFSSLSRAEQFGQCYHLLTRRSLPDFSATDIDSILTGALHGIDIIWADICLAELVNLGLFDIIITTGVDTILEDALRSVGMRERYGFEVISLYADIAREKMGSEKKGTCLLLKVFGELTTREYVIKRSGYLGHSPEKMALLTECVARDVIVIGLDPIWDEELYRIFQPQGGSFWFISEEPLSEDSSLFHIGDARNFKAFSGYEGHYQFFLPRLRELFFGAMPAPVIPDYPTLSSIFQEVYQLKHEIKALREEIMKFHKPY